MNNNILYDKGFIDGCFDLFHYGHINAILQSKSKCKILRLATHNNEEIYKAKNCYPLYNFENRLKILKECKFIDILDLESTPYDTTVEILKNKNCEIFFHAEDGIDKYPLLDIKLLNKLCIFNRTIGVSTSNILNRLFENNFNNVNYNKNIDLKSIEYLTKLYNNIQSLSNVLYNTINNNSNIILIKCDWDLFNEKHIELIHNIKKKYGYTYKLYIDLISDCNIDENSLFNKFETRVLLAGIKLIDEILIESKSKIKCNNLVLINNTQTNIFSYNRLIIDGGFYSSIDQLINYKKNTIKNIDYDKYEYKILKSKNE